jgi:hypothetical protein
MNEGVAICASYFMVGQDFEVCNAPKGHEGPHASSTFYPAEYLDESDIAYD